MKKLLLCLFALTFYFNLTAQDFQATKDSAKKGYAEAQFNLGLMNLHGKGTLTDKKKLSIGIRKVLSKELLKPSVLLD